jgi:spore coat protein A, manganese oxidase
MEWDEQPITETPYNGTIEIWDLYNATPDTHPIHLHQVQFQILGRAKFRGNPNRRNISVGPLRPPDPNEMGWKDTVRANPGEVTRIIVRFGPFIGIYPWHCHILEHEDHEMMRPFEVLENHRFNPFCSGICPDDSFSDCFDCMNDLESHKYSHDCKEESKD